MKKDKKDAKTKGLDVVELEDDDFVNYKQTMKEMKSHDDNINDRIIEEEYINRRVNHT